MYIPFDAVWQVVLSHSYFTLINLPLIWFVAFCWCYYICFSFLFINTKNILCVHCICIENELRYVADIFYTRCAASPFSFVPLLLLLLHIYSKLKCIQSIRCTPYFTLLLCVNLFCAFIIAEGQ